MRKPSTPAESGLDTRDADLRRRLAGVDPPPPPPRPGGPRGIVTSAGDAGTLLNAYLMLHRVRALGCALPAVVFHTAEEAIPETTRAVFPAGTAFQQLPGDTPGGWHIKPFALHHSPFEQVLWLDADTLLLTDPTRLFDAPDSAVFWPDAYRYTNPTLLDAFGVPAESHELESGQLLVRPDVVARGLWATCLLNREYRPELGSRVLGDKDTFRLAFTAVGEAFTTVPHLPDVVADSGWEIPLAMIGETLKVRGTAGRPSEIGLLQHAPDGGPLLLHRTMREWRAWDYAPSVRWCRPVREQGRTGPVRRAGEELIELEAWALDRIPEVEFFHRAMGEAPLRRRWMKHRFQIEAGLSVALAAAERARRTSASVREELRKIGRPRPIQLAGHLLRSARLGSNPVLRRRPPRRGRRRLVVGLSTLPSRIARIGPTLATLLDQTEPPDEIVLALPPRSIREDAPYVVPPWLRECPGLTLLPIERDEGPASKLLPLLTRERDPETLLVAVDDDVHYPRDLLETLLEATERAPDAALATRGWDLPPSLDSREAEVVYGPSLTEDREVDVLTGTWGLAVRPGFFDGAVHSREGWPPEAFTVDDIWFSGHLAKRGIRRLLVPSSVPPITRRIARRSALSEMENADGESLNMVIAAFAPWWESSRR